MYYNSFVKLPFIKEKDKKIRVAVGLSGGVDSAVSAHLLKEQGYDVTGIYMQCWDSREDGCSADEDRVDALKVATHLDIPFKYLNFVDEYKKRVIDYFYSEYQKGRTPNPDVMCNKEIKFGMFLDWAMKKGFDYVATGHYAGVEESDGKYNLLKGLDNSKDQSYFLYLLNQGQLSKTIFPLGEITKTEVRQLAKDRDLHNSDKPDSVGICFIGEVDIKEFLKDKIETKPGMVVNKNGEVIGDHDGIQFYTVGQRHGFRVTTYHAIPLYVIGKNVDKNELIVGYAKEGEVKEFDVNELHWINAKPEDTFECDVRIRHLGELYPAKITLSDSGASVNLENPTFGVAPGQSAVFYNGRVVLGGGVIQ